MINFGEKIKKIYVGSEKIKKAYLGSELVYSAGATVTYYVDSDTAYTEEVDSEATCLSPTTFTPQKDGYTFVGWRQDKTASSEVIQSLTMGDDEITLYAVFTKNIALTCYSSETAETITKPEYYNCGNYSRAYFTVDAPALSGWTFEGWRYGVYNYSSFSNIMLSRDTTIYARYSKDISVNLVTGGDTLCWIASCSYIAPGTYDYGSVTQDDPTLDGWTFLGWTTGTSASADIVYATLNNTTFTANATLYAKYSKAITLTYYSTASTASTKIGTRYFNAYGNYSNPTFTINTPTLSGWTFEGWTTSSDATEAAEYSSISGTAFSEDTVLYGRWSQTITLTYYSKSSTSAAKTGTRYFNAAGNYSNPTFTVSDPSLSNWTFEGWAASASATASIAYESISSAEFSTDTTLYGKFSQSITLSYNGNSATSGSTDSQTKTRYFNAAGNYSNPSFTLASNGFTRSCYSFSKWASGSASGTQYAVGASVTLSANTTFYAIWTANVCRLVINAVLSTSTSHSYTFDTGTFSLPQITLTCTLYTTATGSTVHKTSTLTNYPKDGSLSFCGLLTAVSYVLQAWNYVNEQYTDPYNLIKVTANKALYSNTGLSSTGLASGSVITFCADEIATMYLGGTTAQYQLDAIGYSKTLTYYVSGANVS